MEIRSGAAKISALLGVLGVATFLTGPALAQIGVASAFVGFRVFGLGILLGLVALVFGAIGLWQTRAATGRGERKYALIGAGLGFALVAVVGALAGAARNAPIINDITTDIEDPPRFRAAQTDDANTGRDLIYPGEEFARQQRAGYPDLSPIRVQGTPGEVYGRCVSAAEELGWKLTLRDPATGTFEAVDVTRIFRFVDDISVRVRASGDASVVDVRSKSRDGKGDMGANAARIRAFREAIQR